MSAHTHGSHQRQNSRGTSIQLSCPGCRRAIPGADTNASTDIALCRPCRRVLQFQFLSELARDKSARKSAPFASWVISTPEFMEIGLRNNRLLGLGILIFAVVVCGGLIATVTISGARYGFAISHFVFLAFALVLSSIWWRQGAVCAFGKVVVRLDREAMSMFSGVGRVGSTRRVSRTEVSGVREFGWHHASRGFGRMRIEVTTRDAQSDFTFGLLLKDEDRMWLASTMRTALARDTWERPGQRVTSNSSSPIRRLTLAGQSLGDQTCSACSEAIPDAAINVAGDQIVCPACRHAEAFSRAIGASGEPSVLRHPPKGRWVDYQRDQIELGTKLNDDSWLLVLPMLVVGTFFGQALVFVCISSLLRSVADAISTVCLIPFLALPGYMIYRSVRHAFGKVVVRVGPVRTVIFTGVGPIGLRRTVSTASIASIVPGTEDPDYRSPNQSSGIIVRDHTPGVNFTFGRLLSVPHRNWLLLAMNAAVRLVKSR